MGSVKACSLAAGQARDGLRVICRRTSDEEADNITLLGTLINIEAMPINRAESYLEEYLYVKNGFLSMTLIEVYSPPT